MKRLPDIDGVSMFVPGDQVEHLSALEWWELAAMAQRQACITFGVRARDVEVRTQPGRLDGVSVQAVIDMHKVPRRGRRWHVVFGPNETEAVRWRDHKGLQRSLFANAQRPFSLRGLDPARCVAVYLPRYDRPDVPYDPFVVDFEARMREAEAPRIYVHADAPCTCLLPFPMMTSAGIAHGPHCALR